MKKLFFLSVMLGVALQTLAQNISPRVVYEYTRAELQSTTFNLANMPIVLIRDTNGQVNYFRFKSGSNAPASDTVIVTSGNLKYHMSRQNLGPEADARYANKTATQDALDEKVTVGGSLTSVYIPYVDGTVLQPSGIYVGSGGSVGIGTDAPQSLLHVNGAIKGSGISSTQYIETKGTSNDQHNISYLGIRKQDGTTVGLVGDYHAADTTMNITGFKGLRFWTKLDSLVMYADTNRRVGFGTDTPQAPVHIKSRANLAGTLKIDAADTLAQATILFAEKGSNKWAMGKKQNNGFFLFDGVHLRDVISTNTSGDLSLMPTTGNVGIGTPTPGEKLTVQGNIYAAGSGIFVKNGSNTIDGHLSLYNVASTRAYNWQLNADGSAATFWGFGGSVWNQIATFQADGNVGIGTVSPGEKLQVNGNIYNTGRIDAGGNINANGDYFGLFGNSTDMRFNSNYGGNPAIQVVSNKPLLITTNNIERMRLSADGKLRLSVVPSYADNAAALSGGLVAGDVYRTGDLLKIVH